MNHGKRSAPGLWYHPGVTTAETKESRAKGEGAAIDTRFIPVRADELASAIESDDETFGPTHGHTDRLRRALDAVIDQEVTAFHEHMDAAYVALNPDADTNVAALTDEEEDRAEESLLRALRYMLGKANFTELSDVEIDEAIRAGSSYGVRVRIDPDRVEHLSLHVRGHGTGTVMRTHRWKRWRTVPFGVPVYRRLIVVARVRGETGIRLKLFRDIPQRDVENLLPHAEIEMTLFDHLQVFGGGVGALGGAATKVFAAITGGAIAATQLLWALVIGLGGLAMKSFLGFRRKKKIRTSMRTQHLYDRNLANNASVLHAVLRMIHQEELKEVLLAYCLLASPTTPTGSDEEVDAHAEQWIWAAFDARVDFDAPDALETITRFNLWADRGERSVVSLEEAIDRLEAHWRERRTADYHIRAIEGGLEDMHAVTTTEEPVPA